MPQPLPPSSLAAAWPRAAACEDPRARSIPAADAERPTSRCASCDSVDGRCSRGRRGACIDAARRRRARPAARQHRRRLPANVDQDVRRRLQAQLRPPCSTLISQRCDEPSSSTETTHDREHRPTTETPDRRRPTTETTTTDTDHDRDQRPPGTTVHQPAATPTARPGERRNRQRAGRRRRRRRDGPDDRRRPRSRAATAWSGAWARAACRRCSWPSTPCSSARVAVKLLAEHLADDDAFVSRFRREALRGRAPPAPEHRAGLRLRLRGRRQRPPLHRHGVRGGPLVRGHPARADELGVEESVADRRATPATGSTTPTAPAWCTAT